MSKNLHSLSFRSGFFIDGPENESGSIDPQFVVMRVALAVEPVQLPVLQIAQPVLPLSLLDRLRGLFVKSVQPDVQNNILPPEDFNSEDVTKTKDAYHIVDIRLPLASKEGRLVIDKDELPRMDIIRTDINFSLAVHHVMRLANPEYSCDDTDRKLPRLSEHYHHMRVTLTEADLSFAENFTLEEMLYFPPIERYLTERKIGFNALRDPVVIGAVDLRTLDLDTKVVSLPRHFCRPEEDNREQYVFKSGTRWTAPVLVEDRSAMAAFKKVSSGFADQKIFKYDTDQDYKRLLGQREINTSRYRFSEGPKR